MSQVAILVDVHPSDPADQLPRPPQAFLSHASEDKATFVRPLARALAALGISPWLDEWEIRPGDSLVQKLFDHGLATVDAVVVVVSSASVNKPWVREELDNAMVRRITQGTRLIPVRLGDVEMPAPLRHLVWISAEPDPAAISATAQRIADTLHNNDPRPAVGPPPRYVDVSISVPGLTRADVMLLTEVVHEAVDQGRMAPLNWEAVKMRAEAKGLTGEGLMESLHILGRGHYLDINMAGDRIFHFALTSLGYRAVIAAVVPDVKQAQQRIIAALTNEPPNPPGAVRIQLVSDLPERVGAPLLVVDQTLQELNDRNLLTFHRYLGGAMRVSNISPAIRRLLD